MSARVWIVLVLVAAHGLVLWLLWRGRAPVTPEVEAATSVLFFFPEPYQAVARPSTKPIGRAAPQAHTHATVTVPAIAQPSTAICVLVAFIFAACAIGHIEVHGDLFDGAAQRHDETLATHRPNDAP